jgi:hypothetical protein
VIPKNKIKLLILVFICVLNCTFIKAQDSIEHYNELMRRHWICYSGNVGEKQTYIPAESPLAKDVDPDQKFGGFTFKEGNNYQHHLFRWCGNDDRPPFYPGTWNLKKVNNQLILYMSEEYGEIKNYELLELTAEKMVLVLK